MVFLIARFGNNDCLMIRRYQSSMTSFALYRYWDIFSICFNFLAQELVSENIMHISFQL